jgi:hypothetical protein
MPDDPLVERITKINDRIQKFHQEAGVGTGGGVSLHPGKDDVVKLEALEALSIELREFWMVLIEKLRNNAKEKQDKEMLDDLKALLKKDNLIAGEAKEEAERILKEHGEKLANFPILNDALVLLQAGADFQKQLEIVMDPKKAAEIAGAVGAVGGVAIVGSLLMTTEVLGATLSLTEGFALVAGASSAVPPVAIAIAIIASCALLAAAGVYAYQQYQQHKENEARKTTSLSTKPLSFSDRMELDKQAEGLTVQTAALKKALDPLTSNPDLELKDLQAGKTGPKPAKK